MLIRCYLIIYFIFLLSFVSSVSSEPGNVRVKRWALGEIIGGAFDFVTSFGRCTGCPNHCLHDDGVVAGYCCNCGLATDYLPINCQAIPGHCPLDGRKLCQYYNYMLDCCCR